MNAVPSPGFSLTVNFIVTGVLCRYVNDNMAANDDNTTKMVQNGYTFARSASCSETVQMAIDCDHDYTERGDIIKVEFLSAASGYESVSTVTGRIVDCYGHKITIVRDSDRKEMTIKKRLGHGKTDWHAFTVKTNGRTVGIIEQDGLEHGISFLRDDYEMVTVETEEDDDDDDNERKYEVYTQEDGYKQIRGEDMTVDEAYDMKDSLKESEPMTKTRYHWVEEVEEDNEQEVDEVNGEVATDGGSELVRHDYEEGQTFSDGDRSIEIVDTGYLHVEVQDGDRLVRYHYERLAESLEENGFKEVETDGGEEKSEFEEYVRDQLDKILDEVDESHSDEESSEWLYEDAREFAKTLMDRNPQFREYHVHDDLSLRFAYSGRMISGNETEFLEEHGYRVDFVVEDSIGFTRIEEDSSAKEYTLDVDSMEFEEVNDDSDPVTDGGRDCCMNCGIELGELHEMDDLPAKERVRLDHDGFCEACEFQSPNGSYEKVGSELVDVEFPELMTDGGSDVTSDDFDVFLAPIIDVAFRWDITEVEAEEFLEEVGYYSDQEDDPFVTDGGYPLPPGEEDFRHGKPEDSEKECKLMTDGGMGVEYQVHSDVDGHVTEFDNEERAEERVVELDKEYPDQTHSVVEKKLMTDGGVVTDRDRYLMKVEAKTQPDDLVIREKRTGVKHDRMFYVFHREASRLDGFYDVKGESILPSRFTKTLRMNTFNRVAEHVVREHLLREEMEEQGYVFYVRCVDEEGEEFEFYEIDEEEAAFWEEAYPEVDSEVTIVSWSDE